MSGVAPLRLRATALNAADCRIMRGDPLIMRIAFGLRAPKVAVRGMDVAATVVGRGAGVTRLAVGDEVMGELPAGGGLAEFATAPEARLVHRPESLDPVLAAALPLAGGTAWQALDRAAVRSGQRVLVTGASGGVGTFTVQLAVARGAEVWALCGARNEKLVAALGAIRTFDYRSVDDDVLGAATFDAIVDIAGTAPLRRLAALLRPEGTVVLVSGAGGRVFGPVGRILRGVFLSAGREGRRIRPLAAVPRREVTGALASQAAEHSLVPVVERTFRFDEAGDALAHVDAGHTVGKVVVVTKAASAVSYL